MFSGAIFQGSKMYNRTLSGAVASVLVVAGTAGTAVAAPQAVSPHANTQCVEAAAKLNQLSAA